MNPAEANDQLLWGANKGSPPCEYTVHYIIKLGGNRQHQKYAVQLYGYRSQYDMIEPPDPVSPQFIIRYWDLVKTNVPYGNWFNSDAIARALALQTFVPCQDPARLAQKHRRLYR